MSRRIARLAPFACVAAALVFASGCATRAPQAQAVQASRVAVPAFELEGRLSATDGERAANGRLVWKHAGAADEWTVFDPLGQIAARLVGSPAGARLQTADGRVREAANVQAMLPQVLGLAAPLDGLSHWVQATPRAGARVLDLDDAGRPARIADGGWIIDYPEYAAPTPDAAPRRIDAAWGDARIRLIIDQWTPLD